MSEYKFCIVATWLSQRGHCQNNCFSPCICPVLVLFSCMHLDLMKYSHIYVGRKVRLAGCLAVFLLERKGVFDSRTDDFRVSPSLTEDGIFSMLERTLQSCISVLERNLSLFTYMSPGNSTIAAVSAAVYVILVFCSLHGLLLHFVIFLLSRGGEKPQEIVVENYFSETTAASFFTVLICEI